MQSMKPQPNIQCSHCSHKWFTGSKAKAATCPFCQLKTSNPQTTVIDMKPLYLKYVRDMKPEPKKIPKIPPLDYVTNRAQLEQEFIELYKHTWIKNGGSVRPVGLKKIPSRSLARYIEIAKIPLKVVS